MAQKKIKILVAEDDPASLDFLRSLLIHSGYDVVEAVDGAKALACVKAEKPDLVVSDILMPAMDGFELAEKIRTDPNISQVPIVFYSATYNEKQAQWLADACGVSERLDKPADPEVILNSVKKALASSPKPLSVDPYLLAEEHARLLSDKVAAKVQELQENKRRLEAEVEQRKASEARYRSLLEDLPLGVFVCNLQEDRFASVNPAMVRILGYITEEEVLKLSVSRDVYLVPEECANSIEQIKSQRITIGKEMSWKRQDGSPILVRASCRCTDGDSRVEGIAEDITWQRELEIQLRQTQKLESLGRLAGGVAHDFNNLLMAISGYSDLLLGKLEPGSPLRKYAEQIKKTTQRSAGLTKQLLAFSRKQVIPTTVVDLRELLGDISNMLRHLLGSHIMVSIDIGARPLLVEADRNQLEQVIVNLAVNARDAMPQGGSLSLKASTAEVTDKGGLAPGWYIALAVSDTGHGIEKHLQQKIFEPFFSTKGEHGTGLGLATVYGIVKQAKGEIRLQSELGVGTTFTVLLPISTMTAGEMNQAKKEVLPATARGHERLLLVDDEEALRVSMQEYLEAEGYTVLCARNGGEALDILSKDNRTIQMIVTDLTMPGVSGSDLACKAWERNPGLPVIFVSGYMDDATHEFMTTRTAGTDYIQKPFPLSELVIKVRSLLDLTMTPPMAVVLKRSPAMPSSR